MFNFFVAVYYTILW